MAENAQKYEKLDQIIRQHKDEPGNLMPVMQEAQEIFGCVPLDVQERIADGLGVTLSEVYGVATFYSQFALEPKGKYVISVCLGTACYVNGADKVKAGNFPPRSQPGTAVFLTVTPPAQTVIVVR